MPRCVCVSCCTSVSSTLAMQSHMSTHELYYVLVNRITQQLETWSLLRLNAAAASSCLLAVAGKFGERFKVLDWCCLWSRSLAVWKLSKTAISVVICQSLPVFVDIYSLFYFHLMSSIKGADGKNEQGFLFMLHSGIFRTCRSGRDRYFALSRIHRVDILFTAAGFSHDATRVIWG